LVVRQVARPVWLVVLNESREAGGVKGLADFYHLATGDLRMLSKVEAGESLLSLRGIRATDRTRADSTQPRSSSNNQQPTTNNPTYSSAIAFVSRAFASAATSATALLSGTTAIIVAGSIAETTEEFSPAS